MFANRVVDKKQQRKSVASDWAGDVAGGLDDADTDGDLDVGQI